MTAPAQDRRSTRLHNRARRRLRDFVGVWGDVLQLAMAIVIVAICVALVPIALSVRASGIAREHAAAAARAQAASTQKVSHLACVRTRKFGPAIADFLQDNAVFERRYGPVRGRRVQGEYRSTIPTSCP